MLVRCHCLTELLDVPKVSKLLVLSKTILKFANDYRYANSVVVVVIKRSHTKSYVAARLDSLPLHAKACRRATGFVVELRRVVEARSGVLLLFVSTCRCVKDVSVAEN